MKAKKKNMTYAQARKRMAEIAKEIGNDYYSIEYRETYHNGKLLMVSCRSYMDGHSHNAASSFDESILSLELDTGIKKMPALQKSAPRTVKEVKNED